jgi:two-component system NtrC family sensor kinase
VVNDVLDFARPIRFDYASTDVNAVCADAEHATRATAPDMPDMTVQLHPDPALRHVVTDAERLRTALVNILVNSRHAVAARAAKDAPNAPDIELQTMNGANGYVTIVVRDRGVGIKPEDLARAFDPYFTTKRTGSGLGLAISKNIVEGMGGSIALRSQPGQGTEIRIDIPDRTNLS